MGWRLVASVFVVSLALNAIWEMAHMGAYAEMAGRLWQATVLRCMRSALVDAGLALGIWGLARWIVRSPGSLQWRLALVMALMGALVAVLVEAAALESGWWSYSNRMPRLPLLQVGVWPVLQLAILPALSVALAELGGRRLSRR